MSAIPTRRNTAIWGTIGAVLFGALFASAGQWQLSRVAEKSELFAAFEAGAGASPRTALPGDDEFARQRYQPVEISGAYDAERQVLLDGIVVDGRVGYHVLTPFVTADGAVLVNRGFIEAPTDRSVLPEVPVDDQRRTIRGITDVLPRPGLRLADRDLQPDSPWPRRIAFPTTEEIAAQLGYPLQAYQVLLDPEQPDGYRREWSPATMAPEQHLGYAVQWFGLLIAVIVVYITLMWRYLRSGKS